AFRDRPELVAMRMIGKSDPRFFEGLTPCIEICCRAFRVGLAEVADVVWNPRAGDILQAERLRFSDRRVHVFLQRAILKVAAYRLEPALRQHLAIFFRRNSVSAGRFYFDESESLCFVQSPWHVGFGRLAQAVELKTGGAFEAAGVSGPGGERCKQESK